MVTNLFAIGLLAVTSNNPDSGALPDLTALRTMNARFAPAELGADLTRLPPGEKLALAHLVAAAKIMDGLFLGQVWAGNRAMLLDRLAKVPTDIFPRTPPRRSSRPRWPRRSIETRM